MKGTTGWLALAWIAGVAAVVPAEAQRVDGELTARIWLDRGEEPVLRVGERVRLYYRTSRDAYVAIFHVDTNGTTRLVFPRSPDEVHYTAGARDYRLLFPESSWWYVDEDPGLGYFFVVASPEPFDFRDFRYSHWDGGWDLSFAGRQVYSDPYVAMDDYVARLIPDWQVVPYALDFLSYHVEDRYEYPRFLCYDCHGFQPYSVWNPYYFTCTNFRVVIYDDPYYYPSTRYRGDRVVYVRPTNVGVPRFTFKERARGEVGTPIVASRPDYVPSPGEPLDAARRSGAGIGSGGVVGNPTRAIPGVGTRPSDALPGRGSVFPGRPVPGSARPTEGAGARSGLPTTGPDSRRPVLTRRPAPTRGGGGTATSRPPPTPTRGGGGSAGPVPSRPTTGGARPTPPRRPPTRPPVTPTRRGGGGGSATPPTRRGGGGGGSATPPTRRRGGGGGGSAPPPTRRGGGGGGGAAAV